MALKTWQYVFGIVTTVAVASGGIGSWFLGGFARPRTGLIKI